MEGFPLVAAAVLAGNLAGMGSGGGLDGFCAGVGALRVAYQVVYVRTEREGLTWVRTAVWMGGLVWCWVVLWRAGSALALA